MRNTALSLGLVAILGCSSQDPSSGASPSPKGEEGSARPDEGPCEKVGARIWKLTPDQYSSTVATLVPGAGRPGDTLRSSLSTVHGRFSNHADTLDMSTPHVEQLFETADALAERVMKRPGQVFPCLATAFSEAGCQRAFIEDFLMKAFRRPPEASEIDAHLAFTEEQARRFGPAYAIRQFVHAVLLSPHFLYRTELGPAGARPGTAVVMTSYEKASALSYLITDGPPDEGLLKAAREDALGSKQEIADQVKRLLTRPESSVGLIKFFFELFPIADVPTLRKTRLYFPDFHFTVARDMVEETRLFLRHVLWQDDARLETLLSAPYTYLNKNLADFYGVPAQMGQPFTKTNIPDGRRFGLLTHGSVMASLATPIDTSPVLRGKFVREKLLCQHMPPPPPNVNAVPPKPDGLRTQRERLAQHSSDVTCSGCHSLMDPIGLALENYDGAGKHRTMDLGKPLDTSGVLIAVGEEDRRFANGSELLGMLAHEELVGQCFTRTLLTYATGQSWEAAESCTLRPLLARFAESRGNIIDLVVALTTAPGYFVRLVEGKE